MNTDTLTIEIIQENKDKVLSAFRLEYAALPNDVANKLNIALSRGLIDAIEKLAEYKAKMEAK